MFRGKTHIPVYYEDAEGKKVQIGVADVSDMDRRKPDGFHITATIGDSGTELKFEAEIKDHYRSLFSMPEDEYSIGYESEPLALYEKLRPVHTSDYRHGFSMGDWAREVERRSALDSPDVRDSQS